MSDGYRDGRSPTAKLIISVVVAVIATAAITALVVFLVVRNTGSDEQAAPVEQTEEAIPAEAQSICGLSGYETSGTLTSAPRVDSWQELGIMQSPVSKSAGPGDGPLCFAHTPEGALFAATTFMARSTVADSRVQAMQEQVLESPGKAAAIEAANQETAGTPGQMTLSAFRVGSYDGQNAAVTVIGEYVEQGEFVNVAMNYDLQWADGDWKVRVKDDGDLIRPSQTVDTLTGYVSWGGE